MSGIAPGAPSEAELQAGLADLAARCAGDPLAFVCTAFHWRTGDLAEHGGPMPWQADVLRLVRDGLATLREAIRIAVASGHGVGKSALVAWLILWSLCTSVDCRAIVTANTAAQLSSKTWPEVVRWLRRCVFRTWFKATATALFSADAAHERTWRADAMPWSENNPEAFAGLHNAGGRIVVIFDEASAIPPVIWQTIEGAMTDADTEIVWAVFGNPTQPTGPFFEAFHRFGHRWQHRQIDSRSVPITAKAQLEQWVTDYGLDSDFVRVRVLGEFPRQSARQFIGHDLVEEAETREIAPNPSDAFVIGVDVARSALGAQSVIFFRRGRDARTYPPLKFRGIDTMQLAARVIEQVQQHQADAVFVDGGGVGGGVVDRLRQLGCPVIEVQFGAKSDRVSFNDERPAYANKRAEMWGNMREWLRGGAIPADAELRADLTGPQYSFVIRDGRDSILLESKEAMEARGLASPDVADALAITFAQPVFPMWRGDTRPGRNVVTEYDPMIAFMAEAAAR